MHQLLFWFIYGLGGLGLWLFLTVRVVRRFGLLGVVFALTLVPAVTSVVMIIVGAVLTHLLY